MKRLLLIITLWMLGFAAVAQPAYQLQYWVDQDFASRTVLSSTNCTWQLEVDVSSLHRGFHMLYMQVYDTSGHWQAPESHLFYHVDTDTTESSSMEYWFDGDYTTHQNGTAQGVNLLDVTTLRNGFHSLFLRIGQGLNVQVQQTIFYKAPLTDTSRSYEYWFDNRYADKQSGNIGEGGLIEFDVATLSEGFHSLYLRFGNGYSNELRSTLVYKVPMASAADSTLTYWFDGVDANMTTQPIGDGLVLFNVEELTDTTHAVYLILGNGRMAQLQSHDFEKVPVVYSVTLSTADSTMGSVIGEGNYPRHSTVSIAATAEHGYHFTTWSDGDTNALRGLYLTQDTTLTAYFAPDTFHVDITQCDSTMGTVVVSGDGSYLSDDTATAIPNYGYHFIGWSDGDTSNPRVVTLTQDTVLTALFAPNIYTVTLTSATPEWGSVIGGGEYPYLTTVPLEAVAAYGYQFKRWADGDTRNPRPLVVRGDTSLTAEFELRRYTLTVTSNDFSRGFTQGGGTFSVLDTATALAVTLAGNSFLGWADGSMDNPRQIQLQNDTTLTAIFQTMENVPETIIVHDTSYVQVHDTTYVNVEVHDTTVLTQIVHDTSFIDVPYPVHDTTFVNVCVHDTTVLTQIVHDTTFIVQTDTGYINITVHDTTYITLTDTVTLTEYVPVHDTTYIDIHDTTYVDVPYAVHDTTIVTDTVTLTEYVPVHDTTYIDIHDTTYIDVPYPVHDTTIVTMTDTVTNIVYDTVDNYIYDTTLVYDTTIVTDTLWLPSDTVYITIYDTVYVHDTVYVGVDDVETVQVKLYQRDGCIVVEGDLTEGVRVYDAVGRLLTLSSGSHTTTVVQRDGDGLYKIPVPATGVYLVKVGDRPARRIVVLR